MGTDVMAKAIRLPQLGETMEEGTIVGCKVKVGDHVKSGDVLFDIETDKATLEIESPSDGYVKQIMAGMGQTYRVGAPLLILGEKDEQVSDEFVRSLKGAAAAPARAKVPTPVPAAPREIKLGRTIPAGRLQKIAGQKMLRSKQEIPCFYLNVRADVTELVAYRTKFNQAGSTKLVTGGNVEIAYNDFIIKAVATGLTRFPIMTGQLEGDNIKLAESIGVGLAIAVSEGLVAPIVKDPDKKTVAEIAHCTRQLADKARNNLLTLDDLEGGCITVSNLGAFGIDSFIPIVVPGQCSILGIGQIKDACVPDDNHLNIRKVMNMTLSVDHKVTNGAYAAQFLDFVKKILEDPAEIK